MLREPGSHAPGTDGSRVRFVKWANSSLRAGLPNLPGHASGWLEVVSIPEGCQTEPNCVRSLFAPTLVFLFHQDRERNCFH